MNVSERRHFFLAGAEWLRSVIVGMTCDVDATKVPQVQAYGIACGFTDLQQHIGAMDLEALFTEAIASCLESGTLP